VKVPDGPSMCDQAISVVSPDTLSTPAVAPGTVVESQQQQQQQQFPPLSQGSPLISAVPSSQLPASSGLGWGTGVAATSGQASHTVPFSSAVPSSRLPASSGLGSSMGVSATSGQASQTVPFSSAVPSSQLPASSGFGYGTGVAAASGPASQTVPASDFATMQAPSGMVYQPAAEMQLASPLPAGQLQPQDAFGSVASAGKVQGRNPGKVATGMMENIAAPTKTNNWNSIEVHTAMPLVQEFRIPTGVKALQFAWSRCCI